MCVDVLHCSELCTQTKTATAVNTGLGVNKLSVQQNSKTATFENLQDRGMQVALVLIRDS